MKKIIINLCKILNRHKPLTIAIISFITIIMSFGQVIITQANHVVTKYENKLKSLQTQITNQQTELSSIYQKFAYKNRMLKDFDYTKHDLQTNLLIATYAKNISSRNEAQIQLLIKAIYAKNKINNCNCFCYAGKLY